MKYKTLSQEETFNYFNNLNASKYHYANNNDICTPMECVKEMVDWIPDSFYSQDVKILDPCCGNGNFLAYILTKFKDKDAALKNNLFFNEINDKRIENIYDYFGKEINLTKKDFLAYNEPSYKRTLYDLIVMNPPFALFMDNGKRAAKNHGISKDFINKSLDLLKPNGYLLFIVPDNFMSLSDSNNTFWELSFYDIKVINIHRPKKYFKGVGSSFVYLLLQLKTDKGNTKILNGYVKEDEDNVFIEQTHFLPLYYNSTVKSILSKTIYSNFEKYKVETSSDLHKFTKSKLLADKQDSKHPFRVIHTPGNYVYSEKPHKFQEGWKCFIPTTTYFKPFIDDCGMTQSIAFIRTSSKDEAINICNILNDSLYVFINNITRFGNFNNIRILQMLPMCPVGVNPKEYFKLSKDEIDCIDSFMSIKVSINMNI